VNHVRPLKVRKRFVHLLRAALVVTLSLLFGTFLIDMLVSGAIYGHWLFGIGLILGILVIVFIIYTFLYPEHVVLAPDGIQIQYPLGKEKRMLYNELKGYKVDELMDVITLSTNEGPGLEFFYIEPELEEIRARLELNNIPPAKGEIEPDK